MGDRTGQQFGNYRLLRSLGRGGFAEVYLGEHIHLQTQVAIKILSTQLVAKDLERFLREARTIASLKHNHIVHVFDFGIQEDIPFLVMDYAPNGTLRQRHPKESRVSLSDVLLYVQQIAPALQYAHDRRVIHRDVKPENMLLGSEGEILLSDFGIAVTTATSTSQQQSKTPAGTAAYMAPEQIMGKPCTASDQYALGVIVYEWLSGEQPFHGSFWEMYAQHLNAPVPFLQKANPEISPEVGQCITKALAKNPDERFASVQDFATVLQDAYQQAVSVLISVPSQPLSAEKLPASYNGQDHQTCLKTPSETPVSQEIGPDDPTFLKTPSGVSPLPKATPNNQALLEIKEEAPPLPNVSQEESRVLKISAATLTPTGIDPDEPTPKDPEPMVHVTTEPSSISAPPSTIPHQAQRPGKLGRRTKKSLIIAASIFLLLLLVAIPFIIAAIVTHSTNTHTQQVAHQSTLTRQSLPPQQLTQPPATGNAQSLQRQLSSTQTQSSTVQATGQGTTPGQHATGYLTFVWSSVTSNDPAANGVHLPAGSTFSIELPTASLLGVIDEPLSVGPSNPTATLPAHIEPAGTAGNISAGQYSTTVGGSSNGDALAVYNPNDFTGGTDPQPHTFVQQSDIDNAATPLKNSTTSAAEIQLMQQLRSGEHLAGKPQCTSNVTSDRAVNDQVANVMVTVSTTCTATVSM